MHGLINWSLQCFMRDTYGHPTWEKTIVGAGCEQSSFEGLMNYDDRLTYHLLDAASGVINKDKNLLLEDLGTYLCSHPKMESVRRLLRFGGDGFLDFLYSLDDLSDRTRLAVPGLEMPQLWLRRASPGNVCLRCSSEHSFFGPVMVGVLRAMADDYGALVLLEHGGRQGSEDRINVEILEAGFSPGREFTLAKGA